MSQADKFKSQQDVLDTTIPIPPPPKIPEAIKARLSEQERLAWERYDKEWEEWHKRQATRTR